MSCTESILDRKLWTFRQLLDRKLWLIFPSTPYIIFQLKSTELMLVLRAQINYLTLLRTYEVVTREHIVLPDLQSKFWFGFLLCLVKTPEVFLTKMKTFIRLVFITA